jgi:TolB-like protein
MTFRPGGNRDLRSIARVLGVANVVEGTVRRENNRVRITIRLVNAQTEPPASRENPRQFFCLSVDAVPAIVCFLLWRTRIPGALASA